MLLRVLYYLYSTVFVWALSRLLSIVSRDLIFNEMDSGIPGSDDRCFQQQEAGIIVANHNLE